MSLKRLDSDSDSPPKLMPAKSATSLRLANYANGRLIMHGLNSSPSSSSSVVSPLGSAKSSARNSPRSRMSPTSMQLKFSVISPRSSGLNSPIGKVQSPYVGKMSVPPSCPSSTGTSPYRLSILRISKNITLSPTLNAPNQQRMSQSLNTSPKNQNRRVESKAKAKNRRRRSLPLQRQENQPVNFFDIDSLEIPEGPNILVHTAPSSPKLRRRVFRSHSGHTTPSTSGSPPHVSVGRPLHNTKIRRRQKGREKTALFVDSITLDSKLMCVLLGQLGYHTTCVATSDEALYMTQHNIYDVILLEAQKMDARGCCRKMRNMERIKGQQVTPVFALTAEVKEEALQLDNKSGMSGAIQKGAVLARMIPKAIKLAQQKADTFIFINTDGRINEQEGLSRTHLENKLKESDLKLRFRIVTTSPSKKKINNRLSHNQRVPRRHPSS